LSVPLNMFILRFYDGAKLNIGLVAACALFLFLVSLGSALPPALRASRISPAIATRNV
jgi:ABC-type lipoprotein release transport system permease subunit